MKAFIAVAAILALTSPTAFAEKCKPGDNCKPPNCRCWDDPAAPGGFGQADIPQMVIVSFEYAVNRANVGKYKDLFKDLKNPNGCEARGTFFVQRKWTDFKVVKDLYKDGHEIGLMSAFGTEPLHWTMAYHVTKHAIRRKGIPANAIQGMRAPQFKVGGNNQFHAAVMNNLAYDSSCLTIEFMKKDSFLWPYTYDFIEGTPKCVIGQAPSKPFPGKWQFILADLQFEGYKCAAPSGCAPRVKDTEDVFRFLYDSFALHFDQGNRAPFLLPIDPAWLITQRYHFEGTRLFLDYIRAAFDDVWIVSTQQALDWIKNPVKASEVRSPNSTFTAWQC